jgi:hypothetical protein
VWNGEAVAGLIPREPPGIVTDEHEMSRALGKDARCKVSALDGIVSGG